MIKWSCFTTNKLKLIVEFGAGDKILGIGANVQMGIWIAQVAQRGELYALLCSNYFVISYYLFVERSDYFVELSDYFVEWSDYFLERSDRKMERNDLERSDYGTKWPDTLNSCACPHIDNNNNNNVLQPFITVVAQ